MSMRDVMRTPATRAALGVMAVAAAVTAWTLVRAFQRPALPELVPVTIASLETAAAGGNRPPADINAAVESDLFSEDRSAPSAPYRMPGENKPDDTPKAEPVKPIVLGTAVATDGRHFATVTIGDARPTLVHVGDRIGEWVVRSIERGKVAFVNVGGARIEVTVPKPGT
jgi:hypothetical protein